MTTGDRIVVGGRILWLHQHNAMTYAQARAFLYGTRQRCRPVTVGCVRYWHVSKAVGA